MTFLVDAQLPRRLAHRLRDRGHIAFHTLDLERGNRTPVTGHPARLLLISTGNIDTGDLDRLVLANLADIVAAFATSSFIELTKTSIVVHGR